MKDKRI